MRATLVAAMLLAATLGGATVPARAGSVGDAVVAMGGWIGDAEAALSRWLDQVWRHVVSIGRDKRTAGAFRRLAIEAPDQIDALAERAGYSLSTYAVKRSGRQNLLLRFRFDRELDASERRSLVREIGDTDALDIRPELALLRILLDAADWRDTGAGGRFELTGVEVEVDDTVSSRFIFSKPMAP